MKSPTIYNTRRPSESLSSLGVTCCSLLAAAAFFASTELTAAPIPVPAGLGPGDAYHLAFVSSTVTSATSPTLADYDAHVQSAANAAGIGASEGITWKAIASTGHPQPIVFARANAFISAPVYNMNLELVATSYADFWDATHSASLRYTELGTTTFYGSVWTGSNFSGTNWSFGGLGSANPRVGNPADTDDDWVQDDSYPASTLLPLYALSEPIMIVPEPASALLLAIGVIAIGARRRSSLRHSP